MMYIGFSLIFVARDFMHGTDQIRIDGPRSVGGMSLVMVET